MGRLFIFMGPSGSGKTTIGKAVAENLGLKKFVTMTTRPARAGEVDGVDYHFVTREEFLKLKAEGKLAEENKYDGHFYGTTREALISIAQSPYNFYSILTKDCYDKYIQCIPEASIYVVFIKSDIDINKARLAARDSDQKSINTRLKIYQEDMEGLKLADIVVNNNSMQDFDLAVKKITHFVKQSYWLSKKPVTV